MQSKRIMFDGVFRQIDGDTRAPVMLTFEDPGGPGASLVLRVEFELPKRPMRFASWFDYPQLAKFADDLDRMSREEIGGTSLWDSDRMLHLYLQTIEKTPGVVSFSGFSYDYRLAETAYSPLEDAEEELPDLLQGELLGLLVAFQGIVVPVGSLRELAALIRSVVGDGGAAQS